MTGVGVKCQGFTLAIDSDPIRQSRLTWSINSIGDPAVKELTGDRVECAVEAVQIAGRTKWNGFVKQVINSQREAPTALATKIW